MTLIADSEVSSVSQVSASQTLACCVSQKSSGVVPDGTIGEDEMTQKQEQQQDKSQIKPEAVELEDAQLEQAQGGAIYMKVDGIAPTTMIKDGTSHISDGTSNTRF